MASPGRCLDDASALARNDPTVLTKSDPPRRQVPVRRSGAIVSGQSNAQLLTTFATRVGLAAVDAPLNEGTIFVRACVINAEGSAPPAWMILPPAHVARTTSVHRVGNSI